MGLTGGCRWCENGEKEVEIHWCISSFLSILFGSSRSSFAGACVCLFLICIFVRPSFCSWCFVDVAFFVDVSPVFFCVSCLGRNLQGVFYMLWCCDVSLERCELWFSGQCLMRDEAHVLVRALRGKSDLVEVELA